ncbi:response regulator transcription factor [Raoultibacter massiliensis]|uniref:response regulator transcription factor n=1 Tax=Raoultibacter massiliensis TaxID=1852371 RepID=UPI003A927EA0
MPIARLVELLVIEADEIRAIRLHQSERSIFSNWGAAAKDTSSSDKSPFDHVIARIDGLSSIYALTQRETEVLYLMAKGKTVAGIGSDMFIAEGTVKAHIQHIYQKLDVHSRKELMDLLGAERE